MCRNDPESSYFGGDSCRGGGVARARGKRGSRKEELLLDEHCVPAARPAAEPSTTSQIRLGDNINDLPNSEITIVGRRDHLCTSSGPEESNLELA